MFEPPLPVVLELSFIRTRTLPSTGSIEGARRPKLFERLERAHLAKHPSTPLGIEELVRMVETELVVSEPP